jgi:hypothetical protein
LTRAFDGNRPPADVKSVLQHRALVWDEAVVDYGVLFLAIPEIEPITTLQGLHVRHLAA